jgi:formate hydrogenlyase subunit 4
MRRIIVLLTVMTVMAALLVMEAGSASAQVGTQRPLPLEACQGASTPVISGVTIDGVVFECHLAAPPGGDIIGP